MADNLERDLLSRPIRLAAELSGQDETTLESLFTSARVLVRLEESFTSVSDARQTFLFAANQVIRFCPIVAVCVPPAATDLVDEVRRIGSRVHGEKHQIHVARLEDAKGFQAIVNIGTEILGGLPSVTVNSTGWVARVGTGDIVDARLSWAPGASNAIGALAAGSFGAGLAFLFLVGWPLPTPPSEISLFNNETGIAGTLCHGPSLPEKPLELDGFLVGCGAVSNGWAYAMKRLPIVGRLEAIDRQALAIENIGPYVASSREWLGKPKADIIAALLRPAIVVTPRPDEWEYFTIRLRHGLTVPPIIVNGLDNVQTRHSVQRLWPEILIDMAAHGLTSQVILKARDSDSICLLRALHRPEREVHWAERRAHETGLSMKRILQGATTEVTEEDIARAPSDKRMALQSARERGQLVCGRVTEQNLGFESRNTDFAPAVPFVTGFSGVLGAAATVRWLMGYHDDMGYQYQRSFRSGRGQRLAMRCDVACECRAEDRSGP